MLAKQHGADPSDAEDAPVQLAHLAEDVGLLNPLHDPSLVKTNVVEVAGLVAILVAGAPYNLTWAELVRNASSRDDREGAAPLG
jgi:hypothetical protein